MSASPQTTVLEEQAGLGTAQRQWNPVSIGLAAAFILAGLWCFRPQLTNLWGQWTVDNLRSIGMLIPPCSLWLALRAWKAEDWKQGGSWWGLALIGAALSLGFASSRLHVLLSTGAGLGARAGVLSLVPAGVLLAIYASGAVLLFGGTRAWMSAKFALALLIFVNPIPHAVSALLDLPLQYFAAQCARGFAAWLNVPISEGTLKMMFAPNLGMFIAPGCNGLRGAVTMGYLALVIGHIYKLRPHRHALYVIAAISLAYVFNLLRLFGVVIYYWFALRIPAIDSYGTQVDYVIGGTLFFAAASFLFGVPRIGQTACPSSS